MVASAIFHYLGPSFAVLLFTQVPVNGVTWLRVVSAALVFMLWRKPWRVFAATNGQTRGLIACLGVVFAVMNYSFYLAIDRLPLGTVAAIEFIGPIALALAGTHSRRNLFALTLAVLGVYLLTDVRFAGEPIGFFWAFANTALFALYIVLAHRISRSDPSTKPVDRLGAAMVIAAVVIMPFGLAGAMPALTDLLLLGAGLGVGLCSSVIPYVCDQLAMTKLARSTYSLFVALFPATAVLIGILVLRQFPTWIEVVAVALVIGGVLLHRELTPAANLTSRHGRQGGGRV